MSTRSPELADIIRQAIDDRLVDVHTMLPGRIDAYDPATQKADVEPLIKRLQQTVDGEINEELPIIPGVPVVFPRAGGYKLTMPVAKGNRCMLVFCERSIETYQTGQGRSGSSELISQSDPQTFEMHSLSDPVALLGWYNDAESLSETDQDGMQLGKDGGAIVHIEDDLVELYEKGASQFVALAQKTRDELDRVKSDLDAIKAFMDPLIVVLNTPVSEPGNGSPSAFQAAIGITLSGITYPTPTDTNPVNAEKVKAT